MMYMEIGIALIILITVVVLFFVLRKKDNFDISIDPVKETSYTYIEELNPPSKREKMPPVDAAGLNPEDNTDTDLDTFLKLYNDDFNAPYTAERVAKRYCDITYMNNRRWFTSKWNSSPYCQIDIKKTIEEKYPNTPRKPRVFQ